MDVLNEISEKNCPACDVGPAGREVGYLSPGSCIDYAYDELKVILYRFIIYYRLNILLLLKYTIKILIFKMKFHTKVEQYQVSYKCRSLLNRENKEYNKNLKIIIIHVSLKQKASINF